MLTLEKYYIDYVAEICNISKSRLRFYEKKEILKFIERDSNNKRLYSKDDIEMIKFIKCLSTLNMTLKEIKKNTNTLYEKKTDVKTILTLHLEVLNTKKASLTKQINILEKELKQI
ncbi:MerR family transcriptional regulator [Staphylococcus schleiferi]|uniref:MerR family transcriptional regulator n=1 Tax=Staphylococcus schleiferi TaxID=1295 RepID=A0A7Z7QR35_STASC|nr:MerR family transcriptional regulator [Staphylococcus schleiferi]SUM90120.1 MerR family transcriptional regulator [Staphylococcus schleiferi]